MSIDRIISICKDQAQNGSYGNHYFAMSDIAILAIRDEIRKDPDKFGFQANGMSRLLLGIPMLHSDRLAPGFWELREAHGNVVSSGVVRVQAQERPKPVSPPVV